MLSTQIQGACRTRIESSDRLFKQMIIHGVLEVMQAAEAPESMLMDLWEKLLEEALVSTKGRTLASDSSNHHDVLELSKRLWGSSSADHLYATHKILREDEVYFYRLKTRPPTFHVRSRSEVERLRRQKELVRKRQSVCVSLCPPARPQLVRSVPHSAVCAYTSFRLKYI